LECLGYTCCLWMLIYLRNHILNTFFKWNKTIKLFCVIFPNLQLLKYIRYEFIIDSILYYLKLYLIFDYTIKILNVKFRDWRHNRLRPKSRSKKSITIIIQTLIIRFSKNIRWLRYHKLYLNNIIQNSFDNIVQISIKIDI
jgi:hypothetical protein